MQMAAPIGKKIKKIRKYPGESHCDIITCTHAYMYKHDNFMQMAAPIGN